MNRITFENDDVIQEALMLDSDSKDEDLIDTGPTPFKGNFKTYPSKWRENENAVKINVNEDFTNKEMKQDPENKSRCAKHLQEIEKTELQNDDGVKKKRKSLILSFPKNGSFIFSPKKFPHNSLKLTVKSDIKNVTPKSSKRQSLDSGISEKIDKDNHEKPYDHYINTKDLDDKEQSFIKKSKTPIFYECPVCLLHFTKKEIDVHRCNNSPCLTLKFSKRTSIKNNIDKYDRNMPKTTKKSGIFKEFPKTDIKTFNQKESEKVNHKKDNIVAVSTESKQQITSQDQNEIVLKKHNQPISLANENQTEAVRKKSMKRKYPDFEKSIEKEEYESKTKNKKIVKQNNETNLSIGFTLGGSIEETASKKSTTKNTDQPKNQKVITSKDEKFNKSKATDLNSIPQFENNITLRSKRSKDQKNETVLSLDTLEGSVVEMLNKKSTAKNADHPKNQQVSSKDENSNQSKAIDPESIPQFKNNIILRSKKSKVETPANTPIEKIQERKGLEKSCIVVLHKIDIEQNAFNKKNVESSKETEIKSQSDEEDIMKNSNKLPIQGEKRSQNTETSKIIRLNEVKVLLEKEGLGSKNLENKKEEIVPLQNQQDTRKENPNKGKILLEKESADNRNFENKESEASASRNEQDGSTENGHFNNQEKDKPLLINPHSEERQTMKNSKNENPNKGKKKVTYNICKRNKRSSKSVKMKVGVKTRLNALKVPLEKEAQDNQNLENKESEAVAPRNEQDGKTESEHSISQEQAKSLLINPESEERQTVKISDNLQEQEKTPPKKADEFSKDEELSKNFSRHVRKYKMFQLNKVSPKNEVEVTAAGTYKLFRLNEMKILLEKEKEGTDNRNLEIVEADLTLSENNNGTEQEKATQIESNQVDNRKTRNLSIFTRGNVKIITVSNRANYYQGDTYGHCDQISNQNLIKEITEQIISTNTISINKTSTETIFHSELSNTIEEKAFEKEKSTDVTEISEPITLQHSKIEGHNTDQIQRDNEIDKSIAEVNEKEKLILNEVEKSEPNIKDKNSERNKSNQQNEDFDKIIVDKSLNKDKSIQSEIALKEFGIREDNFKIQENISMPLEEPQNENEKVVEKRVSNNLHNDLANMGNTITSENADHSYSSIDENNLSINAVDSEHTTATQDIEDSYSVIDENVISTDKINYTNSETHENDTIIIKNKRTKEGLITAENQIINSEIDDNEISPTKNEITITNNDENQIFESTTIEHSLNNDLRSDEIDDNVSETLSQESDLFIEITEVFACNRCSQEFSDNDIKNHTCCNNTEIGHLGVVPETEKSNLSVEKNIIASIDDEERYVTMPEVVGSEITIQESVESEITKSDSDITTDECEIFLTENVEGVKSEITVSEIVGSKITLTTQNEISTSTQNIIIGNSTNQTRSTDYEMVTSNENMANEVITTQNEGLDNIEDTIVSVDNVAQEIIIPAKIIYEESDILLADGENQVTIVAQIDDSNCVPIENVEQEVIITTDIVHTNDDLSIENVGNEIVVVSEKDEDVLVTQNVSNIVESTEKEHELTVSNINVGNETILITQFEGNEKIASANNEELNEDIIIENRDSCSKTSTENIELHQENQEIEKVSFRSLENEDFVSNYVGINDSLKDVENEINVSTKDVNRSDSCNNVQTYEISKQDNTSVLTQTKTNVTIKHVKRNESINEKNISTQNDNLSAEDMNVIGEVFEADEDQPTINITNENDMIVQNEVTISTEGEDITPSSSGESGEIVSTNDDIETIIIISNEDEKKKNIVLTQNEKNETIIIISKVKENILSAISNEMPNPIREVTVRNHEIEHSVVDRNNTIPERSEVNRNNTLPERSEVNKNNTLPKTNLNNIRGGENIREKEDNTLSIIETRLAAILNQNDSQNILSETQEHSNTPQETENRKEKEDITLETKLAAILNESGNVIEEERGNSEISSSNIINCHNNKEIDNENESPITNNQLLDILSKNVEEVSQLGNSNNVNQDTLQKENSTKTKCFRCSKEFTDRELATHNCLEYEENPLSNIEIEKTSTITENYTKEAKQTDQNGDKIEKNTNDVAEPRQNVNPAENNVFDVIEIEGDSELKRKVSADDKAVEPKCIRCFNCSEIYTKTHKCSNIEKETENNNKSLEKPDKIKQDENKPKQIRNKKKSKYFFDAYVLETKDGGYKCKICEKEYTARKNLVRHIHQHEKGYDKERFKCDLCDKTFQYKCSLKSHVACHAGEKYDCDICGKSFSRKSNLHTHIQLHRGEKFTCDKCGNEYLSKRYLINHPCINTKIHACRLCDRKYRQKYMLIDHLHTHAGVKPYKCVCNNEFGFRNTYLRHKQNCASANQNRNNQEAENPFTCKICSKTLKNKSQLQEHEWRHKNNCFQCNICSKQLKSKHFLQLHIANHDESGITRTKFNCPKCDKQFSTKFGLKMHLNKHTGLKFPCPLCEKLFTNKLLLQTHQKTHTGQTPFVCKNCNRSFNNRSNFNRHTKNKVCFFVPIET